MKKVLPKHQTAAAFNDSCNCMKSDKDLFVAFFDVNMMKLVNDTLGHLIGDKVIERLHEVVLENTRARDKLVRVGGDEFIVFFPNSTEKTIRSRIKTIQNKIKFDPILLKLVAVGITTSVGVEKYNLEKHTTLETFLQDADRLLYLAKSTPPDFIAFAETDGTEFMKERRKDTTRGQRERTYYAWVMSTIFKEEPDWNPNILMMVLKKYWQSKNFIVDGPSPCELISILKDNYRRISK